MNCDYCLNKIKGTQHWHGQFVFCSTKHMYAYLDTQKKGYSVLCTEEGHLSYCPNCKCMDYKEIFFVRSTDYYRLCSACNGILGAGIIKYLESTLEEVRKESKQFAEVRRKALVAQSVEHPAVNEKFIRELITARGQRSPEELKALVGHLSDEQLENEASYWSNICTRLILLREANGPARGRKSHKLKEAENKSMLYHGEKARRQYGVC